MHSDNYDYKTDRVLKYLVGHTCIDCMYIAVDSLVELKIHLF